MVKRFLEGLAQFDARLSIEDASPADLRHAQEVVNAIEVIGPRSTF